MADAPRRARPVRTAEVVRTERLTPDMVRVVFTGDDLLAMPELTYTDHYVKILFPPAGADYQWPFDPEEIKQNAPAEQWPVTRTYTIRAFDRERNEMAIDFVIHGDEGLAGPWAARARRGDEIGFSGPGGAYAPAPDVDAHVFVGDEAAIPAIAASLARLPSGARAEVFLEVASAEHRQALPTTDATIVTWVHREDENLGYGVALADMVASAPIPEGTVEAFVHGNAEMIKVLRRHYFIDHHLDRRRVSISGYWRTGHTEDRWQATKREFNQTMEQEEQGAAS